MQNQTERKYEEINGFEIRVGKFYDPNAISKPKHEIRIIHEDPDFIYVLYEIIKGLLNEKS